MNAWKRAPWIARAVSALYLLATACALDLAGKDRCNVDEDCASGRECAVGGRCVPTANDTGGGDTGADDTGADDTGADDTGSDEEPAPNPAPAPPIAGGGPAVPDSVDSSIYRPMNQGAYCRHLYGVEAYAERTGDHAYLWQCRLGDESFDIESTGLCRWQWGDDHTVALLSAGADDWACVAWSGASDALVPVVIVSRDLLSDVEAVDAGVRRAAYALDRTRDWYADALGSGRSFRVFRPVVLLSLERTPLWHERACAATPPDERSGTCVDRTGPTEPRALADAAEAAIAKTTLSSIDGSSLVVAFVYTGAEGAGHAGGSAARAGTVVAPPAVANCATDSARCGLADVGHRLGQAFGLLPSCQRLPRHSRCADSIMDVPVDLDTAVLLPWEQDALNASRFFAR